MALSKRLRFEILRRDNHQCRYCGGAAPDVILTVDHVVPVALGGNDEPSNLVTACKDCNAGKSSIPADAAVVDDVSSDALRWSKAMATVAERRHEDRKELFGWFNCVWISAAEDAGLINQWHPDGPAVATNWIDQVERFLAAGLSQHDLTRLVRVAMASQASNRGGKWKYFCGCCWRLLRESQDQAALMLAESGE